MHNPNKVFFVGDHHFGHTNIIKFCNRPFCLVQEMNEYLVDRHNEVVGRNDTVWFLGDVAFGKENIKYVRRMNGNKNLIMGNHDRYNIQEYINVGFKRIAGAAKVAEFNLTHYPIKMGHIGFHTPYNIHGHTHQNHVEDNHYINVSIDVLEDYKPITLEQVRERVEVNKGLWMKKDNLN